MGLLLHSISSTSCREGAEECRSYYYIGKVINQLIEQSSWIDRPRVNWMKIENNDYVSHLSLIKWENPFLFGTCAQSPKTLQEKTLLY